MNVFSMMGCVCGKEEIIVEDRTFEIIKRIAEGGFSLIYLVQETRTGKKYAAKRITCHSNGEIERAKNEIDLHIKLKEEPHICSVICHMFGSAQNNTSMVYSSQGSTDSASELWMLLPFFKNGSLLDELSIQKRGQGIAEGRVIRLLICICKAINALHSLQPPIAHRDVKPGNVMLCEDKDTCVVIDLGSCTVANVTVESSRQASNLQDEAAQHSTMPYRAPELFNIQTGHVLTDKTDVWSVGCVLHAMCFGQSPFDSVHERGDSVALAVSAPKINIPEDTKYSKELMNLMKCMIQVDPENRPDISNVLSSLHIIKDTATQPYNGLQFV